HRRSSRVLWPRSTRASSAFSLSFGIAKYVMPQRPFRLGRARSPSKGAGSNEPRDFDLPPHHLVTHAVCVGMTGSGKTGLCIGLVEEALRSRIPVLMIDVKGDLANLAFAFEALNGAAFSPWIDADGARRDGK